MTATVRSVRVVMEAEVAKYIADMKLAGRETDTAFAGVERRLVGTDRQLKQVDKSSADVSKTMAGARTNIRGFDRDIDGLGRSSGRAGPEIDRFSGRLRLLADVGLILGPALVPLGASVIPVLTGSIAALGSAAGGLGAVILAFNGLGDAMDAIDAAQLEPTAENLQAMRVELEKLGPAGAQFARYLQSIGPEMTELQMIARQGMFPGMQEGLESLMTRLPQVEEIIGRLSRGVGDLAASAGADLASEEWQPFFDYVEMTARPTLERFGNSVGNVAQGLADMLVAFAPASRDFTRGMEDMSLRFAEWAAGLKESESFQELLDYISANGPKAIDLLGSLATTFAHIVSALAPVGAVTLPILTAFVDLIGVLAASPIATPLIAGAVAATAYSRAITIATAAQGRFMALQAGGGKAGKAGLASKGNLFVAAAVIGTSAHENADKAVSKYADEVFGANTAVDKLGGSMRQTGGLADLFADSIGLTAEELRVAAHAAEDFSGAIADLNGWLDKREALRGYRDSIRDIGKGLKDGFGRKDVENIAAAARGITQYASLIKDKGLRADFLAGARASLEKLAEDAGPKARAEIQNLIDKMDELGLTHPKPTIGADTGPAETKIRGLKNQFDILDAMSASPRVYANTKAAMSHLAAVEQLMNTLDGKVSTTKVVTIYKRMNSPDYTAPGDTDELLGGPRKPKADGGTIGGPRYPYGDKMLHWLAPGEEVISNRHGQADRHRPLLKAINDRRMADGGTAGGQDFGPNVRPWDLPDAANAAASALKGLQRQLGKAEKAFEKQTQVVDRLQSRYDSIASSTTDSLRSDLFTDSGNSWAAGGGMSDPISVLQGDIATSDAMERLIKRLKKRGLDDGALEAAGAGGLAGLQQVAGYSAKDLALYEKLFNKRQRETAQTGGVLAGAVVGEKLDAELAELREVRQELREVKQAIKAADKKNQDGHKNAPAQLGKEINRAARDGRRRALV